jgi:hypothetical protein
MYTILRKFPQRQIKKLVNKNLTLARNDFLRGNCRTRKIIYNELNAEQQGRQS